MTGRTEGKRNGVKRGWTGERERRKREGGGGGGGERVASKGSTRSERYRDEEKDIDRKIEGKTRNEYYSGVTSS